MRCSMGLALSRELDDLAVNLIDDRRVMSDESIPYKRRVERREATLDQYEKLRERHVKHVMFCIDCQLAIEERN
jgi:hypothetical protein